jgi:DNA-binding MarR family transcriptional regulator
MPKRKPRLYHALQMAAHRARKAADSAVLDAAGITTAQAAVLAVIAESGPVAQRAVANLLGLNESAVTAMVARLMDIDLLVRVRDAADARAWRLSLSPSGRQALERAATPFRKINGAIESALSPAEAAQLADFLTRVGKAFAKET